MLVIGEAADRPSVELFLPSTFSYKQGNPATLDPNYTAADETFQVNFDSQSFCLNPTCGDHRCVPPHPAPK
jgi:hypothetical protein